MKYVKRSALLALALVGTSGSSNAQSSIYQYEYDTVGNVTKITNGNNVVVAKQSYDPLGRLLTVTDPLNGVTSYDFDGQSHLIKVTDARHLATLYSIDGLGNQLSLTSPDTGMTSTTVDTAGNVLTRTDAKGQTSRYTYDAVNRLTSITFSDGNVTTYTYDQGNNAKGRLTQISDQSGSITYTYDGRGHVLTDTRAVSNNNYVTRYKYDNLGRMSSLTYPNGRMVSYTRDSLGRITQIDTSKDGVTMTAVSQVSYLPFGGMQSYRNSVGQTSSRSFDTDGRITSYTLNNKVQAITYDAANHITAIKETNNASRQASYTYDNLNRLVSYQTPKNSQGYAYDAVGNLLSKGFSAGRGNLYTYATDSNRLTQIVESETRPISTDANGSITDNFNAQFNYDARGRMISSTTYPGTVQYIVNALGQRVQKSVPAFQSTPATLTVYHYDLGGKIISERTGLNDVDYIYLGDIPVAVIQ